MSSNPPSGRTPTAAVADPIELAQREAVLDALVASKMAGMEERMNQSLADFLARVGQSVAIAKGPAPDDAWIKAGPADYGCNECGKREVVWYQKIGTNRRACNNKNCELYNPPANEFIP